MNETTDGRCGAPKKSGGDPCASWPHCDQCGHCYVHCPHVEEERAESRRKGGRATAQKRDEEDPAVPLGEAPQPPENLEDAATWAAWASHLVATGQLGNTRARSVAKLLDTFRKCVERDASQKKLEETIEKLKEAAEERGGPELEAVP